MRPTCLAALAALGLAGCVRGGDDGTTDDPTQDDIEQYEQLRLQLEQGREEVLPVGQSEDVRAAGPYLVWLDRSQGFSAVLHARRYPSGEEVSAEVGIGDESTPPNYEIGERLGMTALTVGGDALYTVFRLDTGATLDAWTRKKPSAARYDAYAVFGDQAYVVVEDESLAIYEWTPGSSSPQSVGAFGDQNFGAFAGFTVAEDGKGTRRLVGVGTLGTFSIDLASGAVTKVPLPVMPLEGAINEHGLAAVDGDELWWYDWDAAEARPIHEELAASDYLLNPTFAAAHLPGLGFAGQDVAVHGTTLYYRSNSGIYAYDVASREVTPVLLDDLSYGDSGLLIKYTELASGEGSLFTTGLTSTTGSTGAEGPTYRVAL